jgi:hypothetical protein
MLVIMRGTPPGKTHLIFASHRPFHVMDDQNAVRKPGSSTGCLCDFSEVVIGHIVAKGVIFGDIFEPPFKSRIYAGIFSVKKNFPPNKGRIRRIYLRLLYYPNSWMYT